MDTLKNKIHVTQVTIDEFRKLLNDEPSVPTSSQSYWRFLMQRKAYRAAVTSLEKELDALYVIDERINGDTSE